MSNITSIFPDMLDIPPITNVSEEFRARVLAAIVAYHDLSTGEKKELNAQP